MSSFYQQPDCIPRSLRVEGGEPDYWNLLPLSRTCSQPLPISEGQGTIPGHVHDPFTFLTSLAPWVCMRDFLTE